FGDTEVDARQVNLSRFALFFPERREFFLQDAGIFGFADNAVNGRPFFGRRWARAQAGPVVPFRVGGKLPGGGGPLNLGLMDVYVGDYVFDGEDGPERVDKRNLFAGRLSLNVLEESNVGTMVTHGDPGSNGDNTLLGFDFNYQNSHFLGSKVLVGRAWYQRSWTTGLSDDENAYGAVLQYPNDRIRWRLSARTLEENFFPALGFANRTGIRRYDASIRQRIRPKTFIRTVDMRLTGLAVTDTDGQLESAILGLAPFELGSILGDRLEVLYQYTFEHLSDSFEIREGVLIPSGDYPNSRGTLRIVASQSRRVGGLFEVSWGGFFSGTRLRLRPRIDWRPTRHLLLALEFEQNDVELPEGQFTTRIVRGRLEIAFTADLSWNTFVQYDDVTASVGINSRLRWIIRDGRELVLVYNQGVVDDGDRWTRGRTEALAKVVWTFQF
ncbi:MAG: hypothetical protein O7A09_14010, partial [Proteobacteria bacterium]|nr:hypothetical protein [Pseudomonadota bacterium]